MLQHLFLISLSSCTALFSSSSASTSNFWKKALLLAFVSALLCYSQAASIGVTTEENSTSNRDSVIIHYEDLKAVFKGEEQLTLQDVREYFGVTGGGLKKFVRPQGSTTDSDTNEDESSKGIESITIARSNAVVPTGEYRLELPSSSSSGKERSSSNR